MSDPATTVAGLLAPHGLALRGAFRPHPDDGAPLLADGRPPRTVLLAGSIGGAMWPHFVAARRDEADPLESWLRRVLAPVASAVGAACVYPFDGPPWLPFQRWAMRAEGLRASPLGILIHPEYGLWHAYYGALLLAEELAVPGPAPARHPCDSCRDKPCLSACPVDAWGESYDLGCCLDNLPTSRGAACRSGGCRARRACPVGRAFRYPDPQNAFHVAAFFERWRRATAPAPS